MKILIRSTTLDGEPIPGSGETIQAADCLEVVELMRGQTPFTASRAPRDYMTEVLSGIEGGPTQPLPEEAAAAAAEFLTRLARHGLIEFLPDDKASDPWPERFLEALEKVRLSGRTNMRSIELAVIWGRLYHLHAGFPALEVPEGLILSRGTADPLADARRQQKIGTPRFGRPTGDSDLIHGELVTFTDPQRDLPPIDRLEGFRPGGHSMYQRVMVAVLCGRTSIPAWTFWMPHVENGTRLDTGVWHRA